MSAEAHRKVVFFVLVVSASFVPECRAQMKFAAAPQRDIEHGFLLWKLQDAAAAQAKVKACAEQHVGQELLSLCNDAGSERKTEIQIAKGYLFLIYGEKVPVFLQVPHTSLDGAKFETKFVRQMIQQDREGLRRVRSCLAKVSRSEILNFAVWSKGRDSLRFSSLKSALSIAKRMSAKVIEQVATVCGRGPS